MCDHTITLEPLLVALPWTAVCTALARNPCSGALAGVKTGRAGPAWEGGFLGCCESLQGP